MRDDVLKVKKSELISELSSICSSSKLIIVVHYHGATVSELDELRFGLAESGVLLKVVKNSLFSIALKMSNIQIDEKALLFGPVAVVCSDDDISAATLLSKFSECCDKIKIVGGIKNGELVDVSHLKYLGSLKSINHYRSKIMLIFRAPVHNIHGIVRAPLVKIITLLKLYVDKSNKK